MRAAFGGPVLVHCLTRKGLGYKHAENDDADHFHGIGVIDPETGQPLAAAGTAWTKVFSDELVQIAAERPDVVGITAAMLIPTGLDAFAAAYPDRVFDVGIAEQHATTSAAGLALGGLHPVVAVYATFLNRAFDQVLMDVALHHCGVTFCLDRAGVTGPDGASHHGMWDMAFLQVVPGLRLAAPRDAVTLREELREALAVDDAPTVVRYPTGAVGADLPAMERVGGVDVMRRDGDDVLVVAVGSMVETCLEVADAVRPAGHRGDRRRPALGQAGPGRDRPDGRPRPCRRGRRGRAARRECPARSPRRCVTRGSPRRCATSACRCGSWTTPSGPR